MGEGRTQGDHSAAPRRHRLTLQQRQSAPRSIHLRREQTRHPLDLSACGSVPFVQERTRQTARAQFCALLRRPDESINLAEAALLIARNEYPDLATERYLGVLAEMGRDLASRVRGSRDPYAVIEAMNGYLFDELGFSGNLHDYYDPRNSYLNDVIDRKTGLPITLSLIYIEMGARIGFEVCGVGMPGHFVVKHYTRDGEIVIDPFNRGQVLTEQDCQQRLEKIAGTPVQFERGFLRESTTREILARMLANLKSTHIRRNRFEKAIENIDWILMMKPDAATEYRDRGLLAAQLERWSQAIADLDRYLELNPDDDDAGAMKERLQSFRREQSRLN